MSDRTRKLKDVQMETFSDRLNYCLEKTGLGRPEFAEKVGVGTSALAKWLGGKLIPKSEQMLAISRVSGVPINWLITGEKLPPKSVAFRDMLGKFREIVQRYHPDDEDSQLQLLDFLTDAAAPLSENVSVWTEASEPSYDGFRKIPILGWVHAGEAGSYEEIPSDWQEAILTDCRDPKAFGVRVEGNSMADSYQEGDQLVLMPSEEAHSGCCGVCKFKDGSFVFRRIEIAGDNICLVPENPRYTPTNHHRSDFSWIYPVWESKRQLWKR